MATKTLSQSYLNNNMAGNTANAIYQATHGGSLGGTYVTGKQPSGNYTSSSKGNVTYNLAGPTAFEENPSKQPTQTPTGGANRTGTIAEEVEDDGYGYGRGGYGGGGESGGGEAGGGGYSYAAMIAEMLAAQRAAAQDAYDKSVARLNSAYDDTYASLKNNLNSALSSMKKNYEYGRGVQQDDANKSLREAYINYMMNRRNLNQNLAAAGISGGATESSLAKLFNNYGSSRNDINNTLAKNIAQLLNTYENNVASANQAYNSQWADARQNYASNLNQLEQMLAGNLMSNYSGSSLSSLANFAATLADLTGNMGAAAEVFTPTNNNLGVDIYNTMQSNNMGSVTDYAKYLAMLEQMGA